MNEDKLKVEVKHHCYLFLEKKYFQVSSPSSAQTTSALPFLVFLIQMLFYDSRWTQSLRCAHCNVQCVVYNVHCTLQCARDVRTHCVAISESNRTHKRVFGSILQDVTSVLQVFKTFSISQWVMWIHRTWYFQQQSFIWFQKYLGNVSWTKIFTKFLHIWLNVLCVRLTDFGCEK